MDCSGDPAYARKTTRPWRGGPEGARLQGRGELTRQATTNASAVEQFAPSPQANLPSRSGSVYLLPDFAAFGVTSRLPLQSLPTLTLFDADNPAVVAASEMSLGST